MREQGFTLVEVLVALLILSVVLITAHRAMEHVLTMTSDLVARHVAVWIANDAYERLRLFHQVPHGDWDDMCSNAGYHFHCRYHVSALPDPAFEKIEISVDMPPPVHYTVLHETFILTTS